MLAQRYKPFDWENLVNTDNPRIGPITEEVIKSNFPYTDRNGVNVMLASGNIWTDEEKEAYREKVRSKPLP